MSTAIKASSNGRARCGPSPAGEILYRMSPDWAEIRELESGEFLASTSAPNRAWLMNYIPQEDQSAVTQAIEEAIHTKSASTLSPRCTDQTAASV